MRKIYNVEVARTIKELKDKGIVGSKFVKFYRENKTYRIKLRNIKEKRGFDVYIFFPYFLFLKEKGVEEKEAEKIGYEEKEEKEEKEKRGIDSFTACVRKNLKNLTLTNVFQEDLERNLIFEFDGKRLIFDFYEEKIELKEGEKTIIEIGKRRKEEKKKELESEREERKEKEKMPEIYRSRSLSELMELKPNLYGDDYLIGEKEGEKGITFGSLLELYHFLYKKIEEKEKKEKEEMKEGEIKKLIERIKKQEEYIKNAEEEIERLNAAGTKILSDELFIKLFELIENERKSGKNERELLSSIKSFLEKENITYRIERGKIVLKV